WFRPKRFRLCGACHGELQSVPGDKEALDSRIGGAPLPAKLPTSQAQWERPSVRTSRLGVRAWLLIMLVASIQSTGCVWKHLIRDGETANREGRYTDAELILKNALDRAQRFGPDDPRFATSMNALGELYAAQGKWAEAESLYEKALEIRQHVLGPED